ncbi:hypothetical protein M407DRAFT_242594 [Tulasnella calospora MUT 4182]|uniref:Uncharacterized protein n=1 Tax=Tulasnella calospora MUT 4182 TaxID=1051891 RepID=A0A0C3QPY9_9AGAM|nr:hypothetical protein M407DRAFT_242594 [Tulasnella calospora MUT 4182]
MAANAAIVIGTRVFFHDAKTGEIIHGTVESLELLANGSQVANIKLDSGGTSTVPLNLLSPAA